MTEVVVTATQILAARLWLKIVEQDPTLHQRSSTNAALVSAIAVAGTAETNDQSLIMKRETEELWLHVESRQATAPLEDSDVVAYAALRGVDVVGRGRLVGSENAAKSSLATLPSEVPTDFVVEDSNLADNQGGSVKRKVVRRPRVVARIMPPLAAAAAVAIAAAALRVDWPSLALAWLLAVLALSDARRWSAAWLIQRFGYQGALYSAIAAVGAGDLFKDPKTIVALLASNAGYAIGIVLQRVNRKRVVLVGEPAFLITSAARWLGHSRVQLIGSIAVTSPDMDDKVTLEQQFEITESLGLPLVVLESLRDADPLSVSSDIDLVVVSASQFSDPSLNGLLRTLDEAGVPVAFLTPISSIPSGRLIASELAGETVFGMRSRKRPWLQRVVSAWAQRCLGLTMLILVSPVLLGIAVAIRLDSSGPVVFRQTRVGFQGEHFTMYKFRTMVADAEQIKARLVGENEGVGVLFKMQHDPRITRIGRSLRKTGLDELLQLINVMKGEMAIVGPRPALPHEVARYDDVTRRRLSVRPGITGLWQVSGRSDLSWDESVRLDLHYADYASLRDDVVISLRTPGVMISGRGGY